jgi:N-carbamoyl-L-amino-acid hydrolase
MDTPDTSTTPRPIDPERVVADLRELAALTGGPDGARRVCWTPEWQKARDWERGTLAEIGAQAEIDQAGNLWATIPGASPRTVVIGSHIDSVPQGGWLDGALGVTAAIGILRQYAGTTPPVTLRLVDWADEEGARFGRSLFGSSSAAGTMDPNQVRGLKDRDGVPLPDALAACGVNIDTAREAGSQLTNVAAYLELHIEQGPVLEQLGIPLGAVLGTYGVERFAVRFVGKANHAGSTPMNLRRDAFLAAARFALEARQTARELGGVATTGVVNVEPGVVTIIPGVCTISLDQRHLDAKALAEMHAEARAAADRIAENEGCTVSWEPLFRIEPIPFNPTLIEFAKESCIAVCGNVHALPSGPLHDAAEMARLVPTTMLFVTSLGGLTHNKGEDTPVDHLLMAVRAHALLAARTINWVASGQPSNP